MYNWVTISTKLDKDLSIEFENILAKKSQTKAEIIRVAVLEYIKRYSDDERMQEFADALQFLPKSK